MIPDPCVSAYQKQKICCLISVIGKVKAIRAMHTGLKKSLISSWYLRYVRLLTGIRQLGFSWLEVTNNLIDSPGIFSSFGPSLVRCSSAGDEWRANRRRPASENHLLPKVQAEMVFSNSVQQQYTLVPRSGRWSLGSHAGWTGFFYHLDL